jgi:hypothetical protein
LQERPRYLKILGDKTMKQRTTIPSLATLLIAVTTLNAQLAPPAGVIRIDLPAGQDVLASMPFETDSSAVQDVLSNSDLTDGCQIFKWDAQAQSYRTATLVQGIWSSDASGNTPSDMTLDNGEGFIIRNPEKTQLYLAGTVVIDNRFTAPLYPGLTLIAPPYSADIDLAQTSLTQDALTPQANDLLIGHAYWHQSTHDSSSSWITTPPYSLTFSPEAIPAIIDVTVKNDTATLTIATHNAGEGHMEIFYSDTDATGAHLEPDSWALASRIEQQGGAQTIWVDRGGEQRAAITAVSARYYAVARRHDTGQSSSMATPQELLVGESRNTQIPPQSQVALSRQAYSLANSVGNHTVLHTTPSNKAAIGPRTIYVDGLRGRDIAAKLGTVEHGSKAAPKQTFQAAVKDAVSGDTIILLAGDYSEDMHLPRGVKMRIQGDVRIR